MARNTTKWRAYRRDKALKTLNAIEASITTLDDEDLLDLHDIFREGTTPLTVLASEEVKRRNLAC